MRRCPECGTDVPDNSLTCPKCFTPISRPGEIIENSGPVFRGYGTNSAKSGNVALLLAFLPGLVGVWGLGHIYLEETQRGLSFLGTGLMLTFLMLVVSWQSSLFIASICLVFLVLIWLAAFGYHLFEVLALSSVKGASAPHCPYRHQR